MDALKLIPQVFFDAIARVIPGGLAILLWLMLAPDASWNWNNMLSRALALAPGTAVSALVGLLGLLVSSYVVGHLVTPLTKGIQRCAEWLAPETIPPDEQEPSELTKVEKYEWLRMYKPDAGALCAKLRAEFTMYNSLAAVFFIAFAFLVASDQQATIREQFVVTVLGFGMAYRGHEGAGTFNKCVRAFYRVATTRAPPPAPSKEGVVSTQSGPR